MPEYRTEIEIQANLRDLQRVRDLLVEIERQQQRIRQLQVSPAVPGAGLAGAGAAVAGAGAVGAVAEQTAQAATGAVQRETAASPRWVSFLRGYLGRMEPNVAAFGGYVLSHMVRQVTDAFARGIFMTLPAEVGGALAGTPAGLAMGQIQAETMRKMMWVQAARATGGGVSAGLMTAAGAVLPAHPGAAAALAGAGLVTQIGTSLLTAGKEATIEKERIVQTRGVEVLQQGVQQRLGQLEAMMAIGRTGGWTPSSTGIGSIVPGKPMDYGLFETAMRGEAHAMGMSFREATEMYARALQQGAVPFGPESYGVYPYLYRMFGLAPEQAGRFFRGVREGYGTDLTGVGVGERPGVAIMTLAGVIKQAIQAGIVETDIPQLVERIASYQEEIAERGGVTRPGQIQQVLGWAAGGGLRGAGARALPERITQLGGGLAGQLGEMVLPQNLIRNVMLAEALQRTRGNIPQAIEKLMTEPEFVAEVTRRATSRFGPFAGVAMFETLGLVPSAGGRLARAGIPEEQITGPPARGKWVADLLVGMLGDFFKKVPDEVGKAAKTSALNESLQQTAVWFGQLNNYLEQTHEILRRVLPVLTDIGSDETLSAMQMLITILGKISFTKKGKP
jgi:hypothetical protein